MNRPLQILMMVFAFLLVTVQPVDALELSIGIGGCDSGRFASVCDTGELGVFHLAASQRWPLGKGWKAEVRFDHFSHYDAGEFDPGNPRFLKDNSGYIDAFTVGVVYEW